MSAALAEAPGCSKLRALADGQENNYRPPVEAVVVGKGRLHFFSAPSAGCPTNGIFVIPGDMVAVYKSYDGWASVMYVAKDGSDFVGWVKDNRLNRIGQFGINP